MALPATAAGVSGASVSLLASAAEFDYFPPEPARVLTLSLIPHGNDDDLQGVMCQSPRTCEMVQNSYLSKTLAVNNLDEALRDGTTGRQYVFAYSQGARVVSLWLQTRSQVEGAPTPDDLGFVLMGNPGRKYGGADGDWDQVIPDTDYHVIDVSRQYDAASDFPDNPFNLLALLNANAGFLFVHQDYEDVDIYDPANYVWTEGNTTYVYVPTKNLPLLEPLRWVGLSALADALNEPLKEIVERAYDRSYLPAQPGLPEPVPEPEPEPETPGEDEGTVDDGPAEPAATLAAAKTTIDVPTDATDVTDVTGGETAGGETVGADQSESGDEVELTNTDTTPDTGDLESGDQETGALEPGDLDTGDLDTGDLDTGDLESGDVDTGDLDDAESLDEEAALADADLQTEEGREADSDEQDRQETGDGGAAGSSGESAGSAGDSGSAASSAGESNGSDE
ncbi:MULTISPECIES: PE-PPE domain-containing protein [Mycobacteriaceae]|uniref:PE-PPE domain-containing protein n=1 Tax=Mycolicibacterium parafortuitum TaxID=39692 RepID=A0ACC6MFV5_MYCPF|nr:MULTISPECIES: PE-PPE domain-containing protein [Mycobacteriaceae]MDZ5085797.1 PE-PPE domain-containing protein [Mycolicibacterium parafortuitum]